MNAGYSDQSAVAIATVTVVVPNLSFARVDGGVQVGNNSNVDINLQGWNLVSPKKTFTFPTDTIISGGKKIIFANTVTGMDSAQIELVNPVGKSFGVLDADIVPLAPLVTTSVVQVATTSQMSLAEIQAKVSEVKAEFGLNTPAQKPRNIPSVAVITTPQVPTPSVSQDIQANDNQSAIAVEAFATSSQPSFVGSILSWPSRGFNFIKHLFVEQ